MVKEGFEEHELKHVTRQFGNVATVLSSYEGRSLPPVRSLHAASIFSSCITMANVGGFSRWCGMKSAPTTRSRADLSAR